MMKITIYLVLLSLALITTASAERHSLRLRGANTSRNASNNNKTPSLLSTEQEVVEAAIQEAMQYEEEMLELAESLETREAGIEMTTPHELDAFESANEYLETRQAGIALTTPPHWDAIESANFYVESRAEGIEKTTPHENEAIESANLYVESRAKGIAKTRPSSLEQEVTRPGLRASQKTAMS